MTKAFCTVATPSYLCWASALAKSLAFSGNYEQLYVLLVGEVDPTYLSLPDNIHLVRLEELNRDLPRNICQYFNAFELCNALKPFIIEWVIQQDYEKVIFLDSDLYVVGSFSSVWLALDFNTLLLTPHHLTPPSLDLPYTNESATADMGVLNGGLSAWRACNAADDILEWMCTRFPVYGFCDRPSGMFVDQKLLPLLLQYFWKDVDILLDPCLNVAFWNCHERDVKFTDNIYLIRDNSVVFFHMSGFRLEKPHMACSYLPQHANEKIFSAAPWMTQVLKEYSDLLRSCVYQDNEIASSFNHFNTIRLTPDLRRILFKTGRLSYRDPNVLKAIGIEGLKKIKRRLLLYLYV